MAVNLEATAHRILVHGPDRVLITPHEATTSLRARLDHEVVPDVIFIRGDGWSLGAPMRLQAAAFETWSTDWVGFMRRGELDARPIEEFREEQLA